MIYEFKDLSFMNLTILFGKLCEHKIKLKQLTKNEKGDSKKKSFALKTKEVKELKVIKT